MNQKIITAHNNYSELDEWIDGNGINRLFLVCSKSIIYMQNLNKHLKEVEKRGVSITVFQNFQPNPLYENVVNGVKIFCEKNCNGIMAIGGGSAIDVAKCIKLYSSAKESGENGLWLKGDFSENNIPFLAIPTTAGSGSESTRYAVLYYDGKKQSITSKGFVPETVLFDPGLLITLPLYQKKATLCDALCHAIESFWSINSTEKSKEYCKEAIELVITGIDGYLNNTEFGCENMLRAANIAGKAIDITQTTAGHAMCYKITGLYNFAHGHAAIICDRVLFAWMIKNTSGCIDPRGESYIKKTLDEIGKAMGGVDAQSGSDILNAIVDSLSFQVVKATDEQIAELKLSVNPIRLQNHPIALSDETIDMLYHKILSGELRNVC